MTVCYKEQDGTAVPSCSWLPETCRVVIPIKLEFSASVGLIHKKSVAMGGHTILKSAFVFWLLANFFIIYYDVALFIL